MKGKKDAKKDNGIISAASLQDEAKDTPNKELQEKADKYRLPLILEAPKVPKAVLDIISEDIAKRHKMVPLEKKGNVVKLGIVNPDDLGAMNILRFIAENAKIEFEVYLIGEEVFQGVLGQYSNTEKAIQEAMQSLQGDDFGDIFEKDQTVEKKEAIQDAPITKLLSVVIKHAIEGKASDIHIEPMDKEYRIRFRVDGVLHSSFAVPKEVGRAVVSRIKIISNLKIDEKRKPQDGRFRVVENGKPVDFRVSTLPVVEGEKAVLRLLDKGDKMIDVETLGLIASNRDILLKRIREPYGIILITGPTGSGKSTTLYSFLQILNKEERNIVTLEDPVEYSVEGVNQSQIKPEIGYTFASGLRSILRQDPNVIMVGEIRDTETAELSIHAALTGHLVFSTLHTNTSIGAIPRLIDMGIEPFLLSSSLQAVAAQRLVRRICQECKEEVEVSNAIKEFIKNELSRIDSEELAKYGVDINEGIRIYQGKGCEACAKTGYKGRVAIFEVLEVNAELKEIISEHHGEEVSVKKYAESTKMVTMKQDGMLKVLKGLTTFAEVERVTEGSLSVGGDVDDDRG